MPPYVGEIRMFAGNFPPVGWALCNGQVLPISENDVLFNLIGTTYGGDGEETFALPDLRSRLPMHFGQYSQGSQSETYAVGATGGVEEVTLSTAQTPQHTHSFQATTSATLPGPENNLVGQNPNASIINFGTDAPLVQAAPNMVTPAGASQPHTNLQPFLCVNFIISLFGIFPQQT